MVFKKYAEEFLSSGLLLKDEFASIACYHFLISIELKIKTILWKTSCHSGHNIETLCSYLSKPYNSKLSPSINKLKNNLSKLKIIDKTGKEVNLSLASYPEIRYLKHDAIQQGENDIVFQNTYTLILDSLKDVNLILNGIEVNSNDD